MFILEGKHGGNTEHRFKKKSPNEKQRNKTINKPDLYFCLSYGILMENANITTQPENYCAYSHVLSKGLPIFISML